MDKEQRVYIGNRYVPLIMGKWDITNEYESLSIVVDDKNNSYTSKINVPIGIELTNTKYWVMTGAYEGVMLEIEKKLNVRIDECKKEIEELETLHGKDILKVGESVGSVEQSTVKLTALTNELSEKIKQCSLTHSSDINIINERLLELESNIVNINKRIKEESDKVNLLSQALEDSTSKIAVANKDIEALQKSVELVSPVTKTVVSSSGLLKIDYKMTDGIYIVDIMVKLDSNKGLNFIRQKIAVIGDTHTFSEKGVPLVHGEEYTKITKVSTTFLKDTLTCESTIEPKEPSTMTINITKLMGV